MTTRVSYPRAFVSLSTSVAGEQVDTGIIPFRASFTRRSHNQAGTCEIDFHGSALPFDPRMIDGCYITLFMGCVDSIEESVREPQFRRFVGYADEIEVTHDEKGPRVELKARDLTALYRDFKPVPVTNIPRYSDSLSSAIDSVISAVPATFVANVAIREGNDAPLSAAAPRRAASAAVQLPREATAWQAVEHCAGLVSKLVSMELSEIVIRDPAQSFGHTSEPVYTFVFGEEEANLLSVNETKKFVRNRKGIKATCYDAVNRRKLEAIYPSDSELPPPRRPPAHVGGTVIRSRSTARRPTRRTAAPPVPDRDVVAAPNGIQNQDALDEFARRVWLERSRQEIEGKLATAWSNEVLDLHNGDRFALKIKPALEAEIRNTRSEQAKIDLLVNRLQIDRGAARVLARTASQRPTETFYLRSATHEFHSDGRCITSIEFINLIEIG